jgi:hypothetical protein
MEWREVSRRGIVMLHYALSIISEFEPRRFRQNTFENQRVTRREGIGTRKF